MAQSEMDESFDRARAREIPRQTRDESCLYYKTVIVLVKIYGYASYSSRVSRSLATRASRGRSAHSPAVATTAPRPPPFGKMEEGRRGRAVPRRRVAEESAVRASREAGRARRRAVRAAAAQRVSCGSVLPSDGSSQRSAASADGGVRGWARAAAGAAAEDDAAGAEEDGPAARPLASARRSRGCSMATRLASSRSAVEAAGR